MIVVLIIVFTRSNQSGAETIKIGYVGPFTGPVAGTSGEVVGNAWKLAVMKRPELAGKKVEVIYEDDACDPKKATSAATKLVNIDKVKIVVNGVCSGPMIAAAAVTEPAKVILFTPVSTSPKITTAGDYVFRTSGTGAHTAIAFNKYLSQFDHESVAILFENQEYPVGIKDAFVPMFTANGGKVVAIEGINPNETDMRSQLTKLNQAKPQALVVIMNSAVTVNTFAKQYRELGLKLPVFGNEYFAFTNVIANPDANGMLAAQYKYDDMASDYRAFLSEYKDTYGVAPTQDIYAALPFDGYNVLANAIEVCNGDNPDCVRDELYKTKDYRGIAGVITMDKNGDTEREFILKKIEDGKLIEIK